jgi:hypothetical protein
LRHHWRRCVGSGHGSGVAGFSSSVIPAKAGNPAFLWT